MNICTDYNSDLILVYIKEIVTKFVRSHKQSLLQYVNVEVIQLLDITNQIRRFNFEMTRTSVINLSDRSQ